MYLIGNNINVALPYPSIIIYQFQVCVWDLLTGACLYSILAHDGPVLSLQHSPSYVVSMGADAKVCVWERFQGHLINSIAAVSGPSMDNASSNEKKIIIPFRKGNLGKGLLNFIQLH